MAQSDVETLPASMLFYFFADRLHIPGGGKRKGTSTGVVPCNDGVALQTWRLSALLLAVAFWDLRERGIVGLRTRRFLWVTQVWITPLMLPALNGIEAELLRGRLPELPGLEGQLVAALYRSPSQGLLARSVGAVAERRLEAMEASHREALKARIAAGEVPSQELQRFVSRWFGGPHADPGMHVVEQLRKASAALGYAELSVPGSKRRGFLGLRETSTVYRPYCERIAAMEPAFQAISARWCRFRADEPAFYWMLFRQCERAVWYSVDRGDA